MTRTRLTIGTIIAIGAAVALFLFIRSDQPNTLQAALSTTCDPEQTRYVDAVASTPGRPDTHMRYDGTDYHSTTTFDSGVSEEIRKGNTVYKRYGDEP